MVKSGLTEQRGLSMIRVRSELLVRVSGARKEYGRKPRTVVELAEMLLASYREIEARTGKPLGVRAKNMIASRLVKSDAVDLGTPAVLMATVSLRNLPGRGVLNPSRRPAAEHGWLAR